MQKLARVAAVLYGLPLSLVLAVPAHADGDAISGYIGGHGGEVCDYMTAQHNLAGVRDAVDHILATSELPQDQTGRLLAGSVTTFCPQDGDLVEEFIWYMQHRQSGGGVGAIAGM
ncbi:hypothetical protein KIH27_10255 [Mycobacterium sp. M1]|uniref:DUF732 domain-containing protein n=2 Tax=Mycolicibacter acidiphilus TaxID=2835306 RepID=A0ABS5RI41_9MYCO|nr:hypothetical protein [Mycolicibacter acidiphilus]